MHKAERLLEQAPRYRKSCRKRASGRECGTAPLFTFPLFPSLFFFSSPPPPSDLYFFHLLNFSSLTSPGDSLSLCGGRSIYWSPRFTFSCSATLLGKRSSPSQHAQGYQCQGRRVIALLGAAHGYQCQGRRVIALLRLHTDSHLRAGV